MTEKLNIVQSTTEPDKRNIWLKDNELKKFGAKGWSTIGGSNTGGGGTSTDKDALYMYLDFDTNNIMINDKVYVTTQGGSELAAILTIHDKKLYDMLYNFLTNTNRTLYLKSLPTSQIYMFSIATGVYTDKIFVKLMFLMFTDILSINIYNQ